MLTEVILLYNFFTSAAAWSSLASAHHGVHHFGIGPGESASRDGVLRLFRSRAWKSIGNVSAKCWATCLYFVTLFSLSLPLLTMLTMLTMLTAQEFPRLDCANHIASEQDEIVFPGKV